MRTKVALFVATALLVGADAPPERPVGKDQEALQGRWRAEKWTRDGEKVEKAKHSITLVIDKERVSWENTFQMGDLGATAVVPYSYQLDPSTEPKAIDLTWAEGANKGKKQSGIYRLEDGALTICVGEIGKERPKKFESAKGSGSLLLTLKRVKG